MAGIALLYGVLNIAHLVALVGIAVWVAVAARGRARVLALAGLGASLVGTATTMVFPLLGGTGMTGVAWLSVLTHVIGLVSLILFAAAAVSRPTREPAPTNSVFPAQLGQPMPQQQVPGQQAWSQPQPHPGSARGDQRASTRPDQPGW